MTATLAILLIGAPQQGGANPIGLLLPWILVFGIFYFILVSPATAGAREARMRC